MEKEFAIKPIFELTIAGKNVTQDISEFLSSVEYTDKLEDESDEVQLVLDDISGVWHSTWYPQQGDSLTLKMGYKDNMLDCGEFEIDEIELRGQPDTMTVKAIAAAINKDLRTKKSVAYEKQTLKKIAQKIADKHSFTLVGDTSRLASIEIGRKTQNNESDLSFLANLSKRYGIVFSVRGKQLVFLNAEDLEKSNSIMTFKRTDLSTYSFKDKTADTFESASVSQRDVQTNSVKEWKTTQDKNTIKKDDLVVSGRVENESQAKAVTEGTLRTANKDKLTGSFSIDGNPLLVAGANIELQDFGAFSGKWTIKESRHKIDIGGGYTSDVSLIKGMRPKTIQSAISKNGSSQQNWTKTTGL